MLENIAFFPTKRATITWLSTYKVGGGENLLRVPTLLSGIVGQWYWEVGLSMDWCFDAECWQREIQKLQIKISSNTQDCVWPHFQRPRSKFAKNTPLRVVFVNSLHYNKTLQMAWTTVSKKDILTRSSVDRFERVLFVSFSNLPSSFVSCIDTVKASSLSLIPLLILLRSSLYSPDDYKRLPL